MHSHAWRNAFSNRNHFFSFLSVMGKKSQGHKDVSAEAVAVLSNLVRGPQQACDAPSDVSENNERLWTYFEVKREGGALTRTKFARCNAELKNLNIDDEKMVQAAALGESLFHTEFLDILECMKQCMDRMEQFMERMEQRMDRMEHTIQIEGARTRNLTMHIFGHDADEVPFLVGVRPESLKVIRNDRDVAALNSADVDVYCQGYGLPTTGTLQERKSRIKKFLYILETTIAPTIT